MAIENLLQDWREESIKTRIETWNGRHHRGDEWAIEEKNPLKQGLKREEDSITYESNAIEEKNPLKQGLKHRFKITKIDSSCIEEKNPLK